MNTKVFGIVGSVLVLAGPAFAHHSFAMFDYSKNVTVAGEVKQLEWINPHIHIYLKADDGKGGVAEWDIEGGTPANLRRSGWAKDTLKPGEKISVVVHPLKNGGRGGNLIRASRADGTPIGNASGA